MIELTKAGPDITCKFLTVPSRRQPPYVSIDYQAPTAMWTCLEAAVAIVGACLPNFRPLFKFGSGFWTQLRSSRASSKAHLNSATTNTTSSTNSISKPVLTSHVTDEGTQGIEVHRYSKYMDCEK